MNSFSVEFKNQDNKEIFLTSTVKRVKRNKLKDVISLQETLLFDLIKKNLSIGSIISDENTWNTMKKLGNLLPVVGNEKKGIDIEQLEDDFVQLIKIFFTTSVNEHGKIELDETSETLKPSLISELHQLDYYGFCADVSKKIVQERDQNTK